jgi:diacylglycerol kinase family enzyme
VTNYKTRELKILDNYNSTIEADGEIIGNGSLNVTIIRKALQFFSI